MKMKSMVLTGIKQMEMREVPKPEVIKPDDVLIKMISVGVCGSDIHYYNTGRIGSQIVEYPFTVGHECAGIVEEIGFDVKNLNIGDIVAIDPAMPCFKCEQCVNDRENTCLDLRFLGCPGQAEGCLSEYIVMPQTSCFLLPKGVTADGGAFSEPLSIGVYAVKNSISMQGAKVGILGSGPIGLSVLYPSIAQGAKACYVTDKLDERVEFARNNGATWAGNPNKTDIIEEIKNREPLGLDVVFECCGQQDAVNQAIELLKPGGKLMIIGIPTVDTISFKADLMRRKEICIQNVRRQKDCVQPALDMIANKDIPMDNICTHTFSFEETKTAFDLVSEYKDGIIKAMIHF